MIDKYIAEYEAQEEKKAYTNPHLSGFGICRFFTDDFVEWLASRLAKSEEDVSKHLKVVASQSIELVSLTDKLATLEKRIEDAETRYRYKNTGATISAEEYGEDVKHPFWDNDGWVKVKLLEDKDNDM